jgi:cysteine-rich repeat protein
MHPRIHILSSFVVLLACTFDATGLGEAAQGPPGDSSPSTGTSTSTTDAASTTLESATSGAAGSGTGGASTGPGESDSEDPQQCGDGVRDVGEACDDGPGNGPTQPCTPGCAVNICGDGFPLADIEACDDGNLEDADACRSDCSLAPGCGNGNLDDGETCDDANEVDTDACIACKKAICGDGYIQANVESCDDGEESPTCNSDCSKQTCGDGKKNVAAGEFCDAGLKNGAYNSGCNADCTGPGLGCGDGVVSPGERCDTSVALANATCVNVCQAIACTGKFLDCDKQPASGCEIDGANDESNCGSCSNQCGIIYHCDNGQCVF